MRCDIGNYLFIASRINLWLKHLHRVMSHGCAADLHIIQLQIIIIIWPLAIPMHINSWNCRQIDRIACEDAKINSIWSIEWWNYAHHTWLHWINADTMQCDSIWLMAVNLVPDALNANRQSKYWVISEIEHDVSAIAITFRCWWMNLLITILCNISFDWISSSEAKFSTCFHFRLDSDITWWKFCWKTNKTFTKWVFLW